MKKYIEWPSWACIRTGATIVGVPVKILKRKLNGKTEWDERELHLLRNHFKYINAEKESEKFEL
jgi:hypothetical protein